MTPSELVYLFFMSFNILAVSVVLNVLSAIFINAFIVKVSWSWKGMAAAGHWDICLTTSLIVCTLTEERSINRLSHWRWRF